jgi:RNA polymerase sigma factor (sigma-70 family)
MSASARCRAFTELLAVRQGLLRKLAWGFGGDAADRADLLQDMATRLWAGFPRCDPARPFATWAYRVALNVALARHRAAAMPTVPRDEIHDHAVDDAVAGARHEGERRRRMRASIGALWPLAAGQAVQFLLGTALIVIAALCWSSNLDRLHRVASGVFLHATGIWMAGSAVSELMPLAGLRWTMPVLELQERLARLRHWRTRNSVMFAWPDCFAWVPMMLMAFAAAGADL